MSDDVDLEELKEATTRTDRASAGADTPEKDGDDLVDAVLEGLDAIDAGDRQKTVSVWDGPMAAYAAALEERPEDREALGYALAEAFDLEDAPTDRAAILRHVLRLGVREAAPEQYEAVADAVREHSPRGL